jgi:hypothetical protein
MQTDYRHRDSHNYRHTDAENDTVVGKWPYRLVGRDHVDEGRDDDFGRREPVEDFELLQKLQQELVQVFWVLRRVPLHRK